MLTCAKDVRSFVRLYSYFCRFVRNFANIARPITELLKNDAGFVWGPEQATAFAELTVWLTSPPVLAHVDVTPQTEVRTDASGYESVLFWLSASKVATMLLRMLAVFSPK